MTTKGRILAVDYGITRIGLAVCDPMRILATGVETITQAKRGDIEAAVAVVLERIKKYEAVSVVVGMPLHKSGDNSSMSDQVTEFCRLLRVQTDVPVKTFDERFTSVIANKIMRDANVRGKNEKRKVVDQIAAEILLQDYLRYLQNGES